MKQHDIDILNSFSGNEKLTRQELKRASGIKDDVVFSGYLKPLVYFEYVKKDEDKLFSRTDKKYDELLRNSEKLSTDYRYEFNKVFTGAYLNNNLGHEIINFIKDDNNVRYVYVNPWGNVSKESLNETKFVFHIIESSLNAEKRIYELVAISEIDNEASKRINKYPVFMGYKYNEILDDSTDAEFGVSFVCSNFYVPNGCRIFIETGSDKPEYKLIDKGVYIKVCSNPQHSTSYATDGKKTVSDNPDITDFDVLEELLSSDKIKLDNSYNIDVNKLDSEFSYSMISGRVSLEVSMSNLIAYFLTRDSKLCNEIISKCLGIPVDFDEKFEICREEFDIDLLIKSNKRSIVIENKIDSDINGKKENQNGKTISQLSKYYNYVETKYDKLDRHYFILAPEYSLISRSYIDSFVNGDVYKIITYRDLLTVISNWEYSPNGLTATEKQKFIFGEFKDNINYLTWSKAKQSEYIAYMRLKQTLDVLKAKE